MFSFVKGIIEEKKEGFVSVDVNGVGFELLISNETFSKIGNVGDDVKLFSNLVVRENEVYLIGFSSREEKNLFLQLTSVSGVGPKTALQILSGASISQIISAVASGDYRVISGAKGVGKKTAERIVLELRDKLSKECPNSENTTNSPVLAPINSVMSDAILALTSLGLTKQEAEQSVKAVYSDGMVIEEIISKALRRI